MYSSYNEYRDSESSEKITLVHIHCTKRLANFSSDSGIVAQTVPYVVDSVKNGVDDLTRVNSLVEVTDSSKFFYDFTSSKLYLYSFDTDVDEIITTFRLFFSNAPISTSWDLTDSGESVSYEPIITATPKFKSSMTQGKKGINLIGSGSIVCTNSHGYFDSIYDNYIFDNKVANVYSFTRELDYSEAKLIYRGRITGKIYGSDRVTFDVADDIFSLTQRVPLAKYGNDVIDDDSLRLKRRIYGKADNVLIQSVDQAGKGVALTGTITGTLNSKTIRGVGTSFMSELSSGDSLIISGVASIFGPNDLKITVDKLLSDTAFTCSSDFDVNFSSKPATIIYNETYYKHNRRFQVSEHALKVYSATVTGVVARNRLEVDTPENLKAGDLISIDDVESKSVKRVSGNQVVLSSNYNSNVSVGSILAVKEVSNIRYGEAGYTLYESDYSVDNTPSGTFINITEDAEINASTEKSIKHNFYFREGFSKIWLGTPTLYYFTAVANTSNSLLGKYFVIYNEDNESVAFWFDEDVPEGTSTTVEPSHGADDSYSILLSNRDYTDEEIAELCALRVAEELDFYTTYTDGADFYIETTQPLAVTVGNIGSTGFSVTTLAVGSTPALTYNLEDFVEPRDFVRDINSTIYYEVLRAEGNVIILREPIQEATVHSKLVYKNVEYIQDDTNVTVNCTGKTKDGTTTGELIETASDVVYDLLLDTGLSQFIDVDSFQSSSELAPQLVSMCIPFEFDDEEAPEVKDIVNKLNASVMGSLFINEDLNLGYDILDASIDIDSLAVIKDDDIYSWSNQDDGFDLSKTVAGYYRFTDYEYSSGDSGKSYVDYSSEFVSKYVGVNTTREIDLYLYDEEDAQEQIERDELINSLSNSTIKLKGPLSLSKYKLGQRVILDFRRGFIPLAGSSRKQIAVITSVNNTGEKVDLELESLGALYARAAIITDDNATDDYVNASEDERLRASYIVDDNGLIDNDENTDNTSLIS